MAKETVEQKAARLAGSGKVTILLKTNGAVEALVQGSEPDPYEVNGDPDGLECSCVATVPWCSHRLAVLLVIGFPARS